jgi:hypothetical protein
MAYTLAYSGGTITVNDGTLNSQTSLSLPGRNYAGYGTFIDQNQLSMLENFASATSGPSNSIKGQVWFDASNNTLKYNTSSTRGTPTWVSTVASGIGQDIRVRNISMESANGTVNGVLTTRSITAGSSTATGTIVGQWNIPAGSALTGNIVIPTASTTQLGGVKIGSGLTINGDGVLSAIGGVSGVSQIVAGDNVTISSSGVGGTGIVTINAGSGGGGSGVTSVGITSGDLTVTNSPITGSGSIGLALNTVPINKGGTGQTSASAAINALMPSQSGNSGALLTTNGTNLSWQAFPSSANTNGYSTLPGGIRMAWGVVDFGDIYSGHDTETISFGGLFSTVYNVQVQLQRNTSNPASGTAYAVVTNVFSASQFQVYLQETNSGLGPYNIYWSAIGLPAAAGSPTGLGFTSVWTNAGATSSLQLTGTASGTAPLTYDWNVSLPDGGAFNDASTSRTINATNPATFSGIVNSVSATAVVIMTVKNSVSPSGVTYTLTISNPNYLPDSGGGGGGGTEP